MRLGLKYDQVRVVAEAHGWELNAALLGRVRRLEALSIIEDGKKKNADEGDGDEAAVN